MCPPNKMDPLYFWLLVGLLGFLFYISPGFLVYRMYESFEAQKAVEKATAPTALPQAEVNTTGATVTNLTASMAPTPESPTQTQIKNLMDMLNTPMPVASPTAPTPLGGSVGTVERPVEHDTTRSQPMSTREAVAPSQALQQGDLYNTTLPKIPAPGQQGMIGAMGTQARAPAERVVYIERPPAGGRRCDEDRCDRPASNPSCPDMRDYIRKDSIPCWGCKLR